MSELFNVVFSGEVSGRADPAVVRANVGKLFNASEAVLDKLFSGQPVAVKKMVDRATAMKVRAMMKQAGAETRMVPVDDQGRPLDAAGAATAAPAAAPVARPVPAAAPVSAPAPTPAPVAPAAAPKPAAESMADRVKRMAEEQLRQEAAQAAATKATEAQGNWGVAPVGTRLSPVDAGPPTVAPDISGIVLAPSGSDVIAPNEKPYIPPVQVDISAINLAPAGTEVLKEDEREQVVPVVVDLSGISVAEVGAPLDEIREEKALVNPDISYLKLAE